MYLLCFTYAHTAFLTLSFKFCRRVKISSPGGLQESCGRVIAYRQCTQLEYVLKASGKSLRPNKVKASMCEQSLSLALKDNVWAVFTLWGRVCHPLGLKLAYHCVFPSCLHSVLTSVIPSRKRFIRCFLIYNFLQIFICANLK